MSETKNKISISDILLDDSIYPREKIDHERITVFADNLRDGFKFCSKKSTRSQAALSRVFTVSQVAEKHGWTEPMVWSEVQKGKADLNRIFYFETVYPDKEIIANAATVNRES